MDLNQEYFDDKFNVMIQKIESLVEINSKLIQQNLKLSEKVFGIVNTESPQSMSPPPREVKKNLFYEVKDTYILVSGSGTFDAKDKLKEINCEWFGRVKSWKCNKSLEELKAIFPDIEEKG